MTDLKHRFSCGPVVALVLFVAVPGSVFAAAPVSRVFERLWQAVPAQDGAVALADPVYVLARRQDRVLAIVTGAFGGGAPNLAGVDISVQRAGWLEVWATRGGLAALGADRHTSSVSPPLRFTETAVVSEARPYMGMSPYDADGSRGRGVRVAVIDVGFAGYESLRGTELPASTYLKSFADPSIAPTSEVHGTACAEIVHDMAPEAEMYLLQIAQTGDLARAVDWCIDNDMNVVSMSLGFYGAPRDGTGDQAREVDRATGAGMTWVNSSGNEATGHWGGRWQDGDGDGYLNFPGGREVVGFRYQGTYQGFQVIGVQIVWDRWPSTAGLAFDVEIYSDSARNILLATSNGFPAINLAHRVALLDNPVANRRYYAAVKHQFGTIPDSLRFDVDLFPAGEITEMSPTDPFGSILPPSDARGAIAVGAYDYAVTLAGADPVRYYSSRGPTWDGRTKPEFVAGDGVSTQSYGTLNFYGTSASAPHVAGVVAVLSSATVSGGLFTYIWPPEDVMRLLRARPIDFGPAGQDNTYGFGAVIMPPASTDPADFPAVTAFPNPFNAGLTIQFAARPGTAYTLHVFDVLGRLVWSTEGLQGGQGDVRVRWDGRDAAGKALASGVYFYRVDTDFSTQSGRAVLLK